MVVAVLDQFGGLAPPPFLQSGINQEGTGIPIPSRDFPISGACLYPTLAGITIL